jgi:hypothetical protein
MKIEKWKITDVKENPNNPRVIKDDKFKKLLKSIQDFPEMLELRPIVVNSDGIVLGGNMRLKACKEAGLKEVPVIKAEDLTEDQQKEFIIKDNIGFGEWDWIVLANEWNSNELNEWGLEVWNSDQDVDLDNFFEDSEDSEQNKKFKIVLEYSEDDYNLINEEFKKHSGSKENVVFKLLGL